MPVQAERERPDVHKRFQMQASEHSRFFQMSTWRDAVHCASCSRMNTAPQTHGTHLSSFINFLDLILLGHGTSLFASLFLALLLCGLLHVLCFPHDYLPNTHPISDTRRRARATACLLLACVETPLSYPCIIAHARMGAALLIGLSSDHKQAVFRLPAEPLTFF